MATATESIRTQILNIYAVHNPAKLGQIDELLEEWRGDEDELLANIKEKYLPADEDDDGRSSGGSSGGGGSPSSGSGGARRPTIGRPSSAGAGPRAQEDMDFLRAQLKQAKANAEAEEALKVKQQAAETAGAAVSIQAAWRGKSSRLERQREARAQGAAVAPPPRPHEEAAEPMRPAMGASEGEGTRYVVSIPLSMDGLGIGLKNGPDGCPYVAHLDAGGEAETAGVVLGSAILAVSGVAVSGVSGGMDVRDVKGLMAQALRTGQPVQLELRAPAGVQLPSDDPGAAVPDDLEADEAPVESAVEEAEETVAEESVEELEEDVDDVVEAVDEVVGNDDDDDDEDVEDDDENEYEESFEEAVDSEAEAEVDGADGGQVRPSRASTPPPLNAQQYIGGEEEELPGQSEGEVSAATAVATAAAAAAANEAREAEALVAAQRAEIEQLRLANQAAEEQRLEVAKLSSTLQEVMQRLAATESTSGEGEARVESELAALKQSVTMLVTHDKPAAEEWEEEAQAEKSAGRPGGVRSSPPLWGPPSPDSVDGYGQHAPASRARSNERARSAERDRLRARSAERDRLREQLHPKHNPAAKKTWTYKKKHGYNPEVWNRLYPGAKKPSSSAPAYDSMAWGRPEDESQKENTTNSSKVFSADSIDSNSHNPLSMYGGAGTGAGSSQHAWSASESSASVGASRSYHSSESTPPNAKPHGARQQRRRSAERSSRVRRPGSTERQHRSHRRPGSTERHDRRAPSVTHGVSHAYPEPSAVPGPLWLSGLMDDDATHQPVDDSRRLLEHSNSMPTPLSPQSSVEYQPSLDAAVSGATRHSDDYTNFLHQHPVAGTRAAARRPLSSLSGSGGGGKNGADARRERERERSYSDYGVYESPMSQSSADDTLDSEGGEAGSRDRSPHEGGIDDDMMGGGSMEQQQRELIGVLRGDHLSKREELGERHPETVASLTKFVEHTTGMATMFLETGRGAEAWELLSDVHNAAKRQPMLLPGVQNSMACCLRRAGRLRAAESMLQKAAAAVKGKGYPASVRGNTYLNLCAVLSSQGKHKGALDAAKQVRATLHNAYSAAFQLARTALLRQRFG
jgi:hypothetical protein